MNSESQPPQQIARSFCYAEKWSELLKFSTEWIAASPDDFLAHYYKGIAAEALKLYEMSVISYQQAISLNPSYANAWGNLGICYDNRGLKTEAAYFFEQAYKLDPSSRNNGANLAHFYGRMCRHKEAEGIFRELFSRNPNDEDIARGLYISLQAQSKYKEIYEWMDDLQPLFPALADEITKSPGLKRWMSGLQVIFDSFGCPNCHRFFCKRNPDHQYYYKCGELSLHVFSRFIICYDCCCITQGLWSGPAIDEAKLAGKINLASVESWRSLHEVISKSRLIEKINFVHAQLNSAPDNLTIDRSNRLARMFLAPKTIPNSEKTSLVRDLALLQQALGICELRERVSECLGNDSICMCCLSRHTKPLLEPLLEEAGKKWIRKTSWQCDPCGCNLEAHYSYNNNEKESSRQRVHISYAFESFNNEKYRMIDPSGRVVHEHDFKWSRDQDQMIGIKLDTFDEQLLIKECQKFFQTDSE